MEIKLIDVGARGGIPDRWKPFHALMNVRAFEPDPEECARLNAKSWPYQVKHLPNALGASDGEQATLYVTKAPGCSSTLKPNMDLCLQFPFGHNMEIVKTLPVTLSRMDTVCRDFLPDVIKVDTQGTELHVLQGGGRLLDTAMAVEMEVEFVPQYLSQPLFADVDTFMRSQGFMLRGIRRSVWRNSAEHTHAFGGQLMHGDALYFRHELLNTPVGHCVLAAYRQHDLLAKFGVTRYIPKDSMLTKIARRVLGRWNTRTLRGALDRTRPAGSTDWHDHDFY
ncbi:MAG: FkbM family methyltransferase [Candidatus Obscuribacterales bacterium]|nr:FkbM family methyltransferase [Steroidobacteraceae bacterium]